MRPVHSRPESRWRMTCARGVALAAVLCVPLVASVVAADDGDHPTGDPAIPPGEEELIASMLGRGMALHDCTLISGGVEYTTIKATYDCPGGEVTLQLDHRRNATATSTQTGQFAITVQSGSPPLGFGDALASLIRSQEDDFQWSWPQQYDGAAEDDNAGDNAAE